MIQENEVLQGRWEELLATEPQMRIRNAAERLGVSEMELLCIRSTGVKRLGPDFKSILKGIQSLGRVMALTRNDDCVIERKGQYMDPSLDGGHVGLFLGKDIDLRLFFGSWGEVFAVQDDSARGTRRSIQFFGKDGAAIHKVYLIEESHGSAYDKLVDQFSEKAHGPIVELVALAPPRPELPDEQIDRAGFNAAWEGLNDTHDFYMLLGKYQVSRTQALRLAPEGGYAVAVRPKTVREVLFDASAKEVPIMLFVSNPGAIEIHSGLVKKVVDARGWFNVLDEELNLHLKDEAISESWVVRKPTVDGTVTSLECFSASGEMILQVFGARKPGTPQLSEWTELIDSVEERFKLLQV